MATKKSDTSDATADDKDTQTPPESGGDSAAAAEEKADSRAELAERQRSSAVRQYDKARQAKAAARAKSAGLQAETRYEGPTIEVRTARGPNGELRPRYVKGGQKFSHEPRKVHLAALTREQYHAIMTAPLLEVKGKAPASFEDFRKA